MAAKNCGGVFFFFSYHLPLRDIPQSCSPCGFQECIKLQVKKFGLSIKEEHLINDLSAAVGSFLPKMPVAFWADSDTKPAGKNPMVSHEKRICMFPSLLSPNSFYNKALGINSQDTTLERPFQPS